VQYVLSSIGRFISYNQLVAAPLELDSQSYRATGFLAALASYNTTCGKALDFFTGPKLEVRIAQATTLSADTVKLGFVPRPDGKLPQVRTQSLMLFARRNAIERLGNEVMLRNGNEQGYPMHLKWAEHEKMVDSLTGRLMVRDSPRYIAIEKDDHHLVWVWNALWYEGEDPILNVNIDGFRPFRLRDGKKDYVDFDIRFLPVDAKPRKFRFYVKSWDDLNLTFRD
jgi:hypothetical protein